MDLQGEWGGYLRNFAFSLEYPTLWTPRDHSHFTNYYRKKKKRKKKKSTSTQKCFLNCQTLELDKRPLQSWAAPWPLSPASGQVPAPFLLLFRNIWEIRLPLPSSFDILSGLETKLLCFPSLGGSVQSRLFGKHSCYLCFLVSPTVTPLCF